VFRVTFLGHQGWLVSTGDTNILIDPLLTASFGHGGGAGTLYPPRSLDVAGFPEVDAVVFTHEHDDHFDVPSLNRLDRQIPIYLSARASTAGNALVSAMGFETVRSLAADDTHALGSLRYRTFAPEHAHGTASDEWEVFPFVLFDVNGHGSMASSIDVAPPPALLDALQTLPTRSGLWCHANNATCAPFADLTGQTANARGDGVHIARAVVQRHRQVAHAWGSPAATLLCGGGWSYEGERAWMNTNAFPVSCATLAHTVAAQLGSAPVFAPLPGESYTLRDGAIAERSPHRPFIQAAAQGTWPEREYQGDVSVMPATGPACGRATPTSQERRRMVDALKPYAEYLYGGPMFAGLYSLPSMLPHGHRPAVCLALRSGNGAVSRVLRYAPTECAFVEETAADALASPSQAFVSGLECWETDLLALLEGRLAPSALCHAGRMRVWNHLPEKTRANIHDLWTFSHPLRRPTTTAKLYTKLLEAEPSHVPRVPGRVR